MNAVGVTAGSRTPKCTRRTPGLCGDVLPNAGSLGLGDQRGFGASCGVRGLLSRPPEMPCKTP